MELIVGSPVAMSFANLYPATESRVSRMSWKRLAGQKTPDWSLFKSVLVLPCRKVLQDEGVRLIQMSEADAEACPDLVHSWMVYGVDQYDVCHELHDAQQRFLAEIRAGICIEMIGRVDH